MRYKSLKFNAILNGIKTIISMIFPLITFPYVSRILGVDNIGKIDFSSSVISYFLLISGLGISTYATREGSRLRDNKIKMNEFANEIFTINIISTLVSYILLATIMYLNPKLQLYKTLISIQSINIIANTIGISWINSVYEDYWYITIRTIGFQLLSLFLLFIFVKNQNDYIIYLWILIISNSASSILNFIYSRKYIKLRLTKKINFRKHIGAIMVIFASTIATTIYVNSDITMIGLMCGEYNVGLYSSSVKVYSILKVFITSIILVTLPRLSNYIANNNKSEFKKVAFNIFDILILFLFPSAVGLFMTSKEIIFILAGNSYLDAVVCLKILSISLIFSVLAVYYTNVVLLPNKLEKIVMKSAIISAVINMILNLLFINVWKQNGAAITTLISEIIVFSIQYKYTYREMPIKVNIKDIFSILLGCSYIIVVCILLDKLYIKEYTIRFILKVLLSTVSYLLILIFTKNKIFISFIDRVKIKLQYS